MSDSVRPHRRQPTRLPRPWDSPGKNTGVGCHFLLQCMKVNSENEVVRRVRLLVTPWTAAYQAPPPMGFSRQEYWSGVPLPSLTFHAKMGLIKDRNGMDITEAEDIKKRWQEYTERYKKDLHDPDNHDSVITDLEHDILECEVKWALESITMNKASGGDGISVELFQILKYDAVKVLHSICQQIWKTQQWPQDWKVQFSF